MGKYRIIDFLEKKNELNYGLDIRRIWILLIGWRKSLKLKLITYLFIKNWYYFSFLELFKNIEFII